MKTARLTTLIGLGSCLLGCGSGDGNGGNGSDGGTGETSYFPVQVGNRWVYREEPNPGYMGFTQQDTKEIVETEDLGGQETFVMTSTQTVSTVRKRFNWVVAAGRTDRVRAQDSEGGALLEQHTYDPGFLRFSTALAAVGDTITESHLRTSCDTSTTTCTETSSDCDTSAATCTETSKTFTWSVEAVDESITVPAGTFRCLKVKRSGSSDKTFWYANGVGKVYEVGPLNRELLLEYEVGDGG